MSIFSQKKNLLSMKKNTGKDEQRLDLFSV